MFTLLQKSEVLIEALPYIRSLAGKTVVIKYGGNAMTEQSLVQTILEDITLLKYVGVRPVIIHGGGPEINKLLGKLDIKANFHNGLRITDEATMEVVQMVLTGKINKDIVSALNCLGANAIGLCGKDANLINVVKKQNEDGVDLGFVGEITSVNVALIDVLTREGFVPVIAPVGVGQDGQSYNINADTVAGEIAAALRAEKLIFMTDVDGIRAKADDPSSLISSITVDEILAMIASGAIAGGMIPKVQACIQACRGGVARTFIINGTLPHPILLEIFTDSGIGTMVVA